MNFTKVFTDLIPLAEKRLDFKTTSLRLCQLEAWSVILDSIDKWINQGKEFPKYFQDKNCILFSKTGKPFIALNDTRTICLADQQCGMLQLLLQLLTPHQHSEFIKIVTKVNLAMHLLS